MKASLLTNWEIFSDLNEKTFENFPANPTTNQLGTFRANNKWVLEKFFKCPSTNQLGYFLRFWQSNLKNPLNFSKVLLLTLNKGCRLAGCFSKFPAKIFLPSLTLNKGRRLWGCFRENSQKIFRPHLFLKLQDHLWGRFRKKRYVAKKVSPLKSVN